MVRIDNGWELKPTTLAVAATEPVFGSGLSEAEKEFFKSELEIMIGPEAAHKMLQEAEQFHIRIHNTKVFPAKTYHTVR
jgi:hypothetical protein